MNKPVLVELQAFHENCPAINTVEKFPDVRIVSVPAMAKQLGTLAFYSNVVGKGAQKAAEKMGEQGNVKGYRIILRKENEVLVEMEYEKGNSSLCACLEAGAVLNEPAITEGNTDTLSLILPDAKTLREFASRVKGKFDLRLKSKIELDERGLLGPAAFSSLGFTKLKTVSSTLTQSQREAFDLAVARGYYQAPQKITVTELAFETGIAASTFAEHLRKAEAKLLPVLGQLMRYL